MRLESSLGRTYTGTRWSSQPSFAPLARRFQSGNYAEGDRQDQEIGRDSNRSGVSGASRERLREEKKRLAEHAARVSDLGLDAEQTKRALDPLRSFHLQLQEEVESYERVQRGSFDPVTNLHGIGRLLIAARIYRRISQRELAARLGVHESQVSRDERNEYRSITVERASRILDLLEFEFESELRAKPQTDQGS